MPPTDYHIGSLVLHRPFGMVAYQRYVEITQAIGDRFLGTCQGVEVSGFNSEIVKVVRL